MSKKGNKRTAHYNVANDKVTEQDLDFRLLKAPKNSERQAAQLLLLDSHINWLKNRVKKDYGDISILVTQGNLPEIEPPLPIGTPLPQHQTPARPGTRAAAAREDAPVPVMTQVAYDEISRENREERKKREDNMSKALGLILTTIDDAFQAYINDNREATRAYDTNDIRNIMRHLSIWYKKTLGSSSTNVRAMSEADIEKAKKTFEALKQFKDQSVQSFKKIFDANLKIYLETTGEVMTDQRKAFQFISKLYPPKFGNWCNKKIREDREFGITNEGNPNAVQPANNGCPRTLEIAFNLSLIEEAELDSNEKREAIKARREEEKSDDNEETNPSNPGMTSYAKAKLKNKESGNFNHNTNKKQKLGLPPGTKPSALGWKLCGHWSHKKGEDLDHLYADCPYNRSNENEQKASYNAERPREQNYLPPPPQPHVSFAPTANSYSYAPPAQQYSHAQTSQSSYLSQLSREDLEKMVLQLSCVKKYSNMFAFNYLSNTSNPYTLLLDSGGTDHDMSNPAFKFNVRANPEADSPITTIMGTYFCKEICTTPFLGRAGSNNNGNLNIISLGKLQNTPNVEIKSNEKISKVDVTFTLLNLTITFEFGNSGILVGDGKPLADAIEDYKDLCNKKGVIMLEALDYAITIDQLRSPKFDILIKFLKLKEESNVMQIGTLPTVQPPLSVQEESPPTIEASDEDAVQVLEPIPYSDEGVNIEPLAVSNPDQLMKSDEGVHLNPNLIDDVEVEHPTNDSGHKEIGIFPHKFIFKDIVTESNDQRVTEIPATKSIFSIRETAGPPYDDTVEPSHRSVEKSYYSSKIHSKVLTKPLKKAKFKLPKDKLLLTA